MGGLRHGRHPDLWYMPVAIRPAMKPLFHPELVNGPFGDPVLYVECLFQHRALMFDLGEVPTLAPRKILRVSDVFVSHTHMDHFMGFDRLLRICLGRDKTLRLVGPPGFIDQVEHKLAAYTWNLVENYDAAFVVEATEVHTDGTSATARFRCRAAFRREPVGEGTLTGGESWTRKPSGSARPCWTTRFRASPTHWRRSCTSTCGRIAWRRWGFRPGRGSRS